MSNTKRITVGELRKYPKAVLKSVATVLELRRKRISESIAVEQVKEDGKTD